METGSINSDESSNLGSNVKVKTELSDANAIASNQDGGHHILKSEVSNDINALKREISDYSRGQSMSDSATGNDGFSRINENIPTGPPVMSNYNSSYGHGPTNNYGGHPPDQLHPGGGSDYGGPQNQYMNQYGPQGMRPGYPPGKNPGTGVPQMSGNMMQPPGYPQQRFMSGQSLSQQGGPTPTLNQLLQNSNSSPQRFPNYGDYGMNSQKPNDGNNGGMPYSSQNWAQQQRPPAIPTGSYPQSSNPMYRQPNPMYDPHHGRRQPIPQGYPGQQHGQFTGQYQSNQQRFSGPMQSPSPSRQMPPHQINQMGYGHQQNHPPSFNAQYMSQQSQQSFMQQPHHHQQQQQQQQQHSLSQGFGRSPIGKQSSPAPTPPQSQASPQPPPTSLQDSNASSSSSHQQQLQQQASPSPQQSSLPPPTSSQSQDDTRDTQKLINNSDELNNSDSNNSTRAGTPNSSHPSLLRPPPSPSGSTGSRSNTPASITGNQGGSPMPPRPPSSHVEGQNPMNQSPMANQGVYNQQMMPPPMGPNQMAGYGGKMGHPGMMPGQQMPPYNSQYPQGNYGPRGPSPQPGMPGYMPQQYNNANQIGPNQIYGGMPNRNMPNSGYGAYTNNQGSMPPNQYGNYNNHSGSGGYPPSHNMPNPQSMMNTPQSMNNQAMSPSSKNGAQAAAHAVMMAAATSAAASAAGRVSSPFMRPGLNQMNQLPVGQQPPGPRMYAPNQMNAMNSMPQNSNQMPINSQPNQMGGPVGLQHPMVQGIMNNVDGMGQRMLSPSTTAIQNNMSSSNMSPAPLNSGTPVCSTQNSSVANQAMNNYQSSAPSAATNSIPSGVDVNSRMSNSQSEPTVQNSMMSNASNMTAMNSSAPMQSNMEMISNAHEQLRENSTPTCSIASEDSQDRLINNTKQLKENMSHPPTPVAPSPSASLSSFHDEQENISSPSWPGTPVSDPMLKMHANSMGPVVKEKKAGPNDISRLYDLGDEPDRRMFLDRYFSLLEEKGIVLNSIPMISKTQVDLYKLYHAVRVRGGLLEVTKTKKWKEVCLEINVSGSASAAYTCRKNYVKHLFAFECRYDRCGADPGPLLAQMEMFLSKKDKKSRVPSPAGSSTGSQDAFIRPPNVPHGPPHMMDPYGQRLPIQNHDMSGMPPHMNQQMGPPGNHYGNNMPPGAMMHGGPPTMPNNSDSISVQDPFADDAGMPNNYPRQPNIPNQMPPYSQMQPNMPNTYGMYNQRPNLPPPAVGPYPGSQQQAPVNSYSDNQNRLSSQQPSGDSSFPRPPAGPTQSPIPTSMPAEAPMTNQTPSGPPNRLNSPNTGPMTPYRPPYENQVRMDSPGRVNSPQIPTGITPQQSGPPSMPVPSSIPLSTPIKSSVPNIVPNTSSPAPPIDTANYPRYPSPSMVPHTPHSAPDQPQMMPVQYPQPLPPNQGQMYPNNYSGYQQQGPMNPQVPPQAMYRPQRPDMYSSPGPKRFPDQKDGYSMPPPYGEKMMGEHHVPFPYSPRHGMMSSDGMSIPDNRPRDPSQWQSSMSPRYPGQQPYPGPPQSMPHHMAYSRNQPRMSPHKDKSQYSSPGKMPHPSMSNAQYPQKREISFPPESVEATQPYLTKRKKLTAKDVGPIEAWRIMLCLKSGLLAESTWALDTLNILLHDDSSVVHFNLKHFPGFVELLLEHFRRCLIDVFGMFEDLEIGYTNMLDAEELRAAKENENEGNSDAELGAIKTHEVFKIPKSVKSENNFTLVTRTGKPVKIEEHSNYEDVMIDDRSWDIYDGFESGVEKWEIGLGDTSKHVVPHFESKNTTVLSRKLFFGEAITEVFETRAAAKLLSKGANSKTENVNSSNCESNAACVDNCMKCEKSDSTNNSSPNNENTSVNNKTINTELKDITNTNSKIENSDSLDRKDENENNSASDVKNEVDNSSDNTPADANDSAVKVEHFDVSESKYSFNASFLSDEDSSLRLNDSLCSDTSVLSTGNTSRKRKRLDLEEEAYQKDDNSFCLISEAQDEIGKRCVCISNIFRSLSFVPGNDLELSRHPGFLYIMGQLLLLHHRHPVRSRPVQRFDREDIDMDDVDLSCNAEEWWWDYLIELRENAMVIFTNICTQLNLSQYPEEICMPLMDGLLHWAVCPSSCAQDPFPNLPPSSVLSPQRLVLEALCRLCIKETNVDLLLATPPFRRIVDLFCSLTKILAYQKEQVLREFAIVLLSHLVAGGETSAARAVALQHPSISLLLDFVESAEQNAMQVANTHGINMLRDNPEMMGTSLDMLRRAAMTLLHIARVPENRTIFTPYQSRLLSLVMSQILDQHVAQILSDCLFEISSEEDSSAQL